MAGIFKILAGWSEFSRFRRGAGFWFSTSRIKEKTRFCFLWAGFVLQLFGLVLCFSSLGQFSSFSGLDWFCLLVVWAGFCLLVVWVEYWVAQFSLILILFGFVSYSLVYGGLSLFPVRFTLGSDRFRLVRVWSLDLVWAFSLGI